MPAARSIDNWVNKNYERPEYVLVGKLAIALSIARAEQRSTLLVNEESNKNKLDYERVADSWLGGLASLLLTVASFDEFLKRLSNITFITFNYDRCIEQFFIWLSKIYFGEVEDVATQTLDAMNVIHVYGSLGELDATAGQRTGFGSELDPSSLIVASDRIPTFTEGIDGDGVRLEIHNAMIECKVLAFLGFGFDPLNLKLFPSANLERCRKMIVTKRGLSADSARFIREELHSRFGLEPQFDATKANDVFQVFHHFFLGKFN